MWSRCLIVLLSLCSISHAWLPEAPPSNARVSLFPNNGTSKSGSTTPKPLIASRHFQSYDKTKRQSLPSPKIRGVNIGFLFIIEPFFVPITWQRMGCKDTKSEFDCVLLLGQDTADKAFQQHWDTFITPRDLDKMAEVGINAIRIPIGYWIFESLKYESEHFPNGAMPYLDRVVGWAKDRGFYVILDLHGAPGAQVKENSFTGQYAPTAGFYESWQYTRAYNFLTFLTSRIHSHASYTNVGMLQVLNEPESNHPSLASDFYPKALDKIRSTEQQLGVPKEGRLHVQFMTESWGAGRPPVEQEFVALDAHRYLKWDEGVEKTQEGYLRTSCADRVALETSLTSLSSTASNSTAANSSSSYTPSSQAAASPPPLLVGEWSLSPANVLEPTPPFTPTPSNYAFYSKWWAAQIMAYEKGAGWVYWSWKTELGEDWRWSYEGALDVGVIPRDIESVYSMGVCK